MKKTRITLKLAWTRTILSLSAESSQLAALKAVIAYLTDKSEIELFDSDAMDTFLEIKEEIDRDAAMRREKAAERRARKAPLPGFLPEQAPVDIMERARKNQLVGWVVDNHAFKDFSRFEKPLLAELALQVCDWWRTHPGDTLPTPTKIRAEIRARFAEVAASIPGSGPVSRAKWLAYMAPFVRKPRAAKITASATSSADAA